MKGTRFPLLSLGPWPLSLLSPSSKTLHRFTEGFLLSFSQFKLDRATNQTRGIFDTYSYRTPDSIDVVTTAGYFSASRFLDGGSWRGAIINCECADGFFTVRIGPDGSSAKLATPDLPRTIFTAESLDDQAPEALDSPIQISFGDAINGPSDPAQLSAAGDITINLPGRYRFNMRLQVGRTGTGNVAWLFFRVLIDGSQPGKSILVKLDDANADLPFQFDLTLDLLAGQVISAEFYRDSQGNNSGGLITETPVLGGWEMNSSSALELIRE